MDWLLVPFGLVWVFQKCPWKHGSILPCLNGSGWWWWCNGVGDIFLAHFGLLVLSTNWALFKHHSLPEYCCWPCSSLYDYIVPIFWCYFQQDNASCHKAQIIRLVSWTWQWVHFTQMASTVTRSQSNRAPLGCGGTGDLHHGCAACSNCVMLSCQYGPKSLRNVSNTLLNLCHEELRQFWREKGSNPVLARCT